MKLEGLNISNFFLWFQCLKLHFNSDFTQLSTLAASWYYYYFFFDNDFGFARKYFRKLKVSKDRSQTPFSPVILVVGALYVEKSKTITCPQTGPIFIFTLLLKRIIRFRLPQTPVDGNGPMANIRCLKTVAARIYVQKCT